MQIISKSSFLFYGNQHKPGHPDVIVRRALGEILAVPDWIAKTPTFIGAVKDGNITVVEVKSPAPVKPDPDQVQDLGLQDAPNRRKK